MQFDWIYYPATQYLITGVGLLASLCLWLGAKAELRSARKATAKSIEALSGELREISARLEQTRNASEAAVENAPLPIGQAINLTKRAQVLRMRHRGESVNSIAAALQIPSGEVLLLLKIERLLEAEPAEAAR
jgi:DNA-binding NarL/FixJ family response regulator